MSKVKYSGELADIRSFMDRNKPNIPTGISNELNSRLDKLWKKLTSNENEMDYNSNVNHPSHYKSEDSSIECIDAMEAAFGKSEVSHFCICNAFKYIWRYKSKNGIEDINKAIWYLNKYLELRTIKLKDSND